MLVKFSRFLAIATLITIPCVIADEAEAQEQTPYLFAPTTLSIDVVRPGSRLDLSQLMNEAYWQNSGSFFRQSTSLAHLNFILGWRKFPEGSYAENSIARDSLLMNLIVGDYFRQLQQREPTIRTKDLANPFNTSVNQNPSYLR